jgi:hypothetical protein
MEQQVDPKYLSTLANARFEAETFMSRHPEWFCTPENGKIMTDYMSEKSMALTAENFEVAFERLKARGKILPAKEVIARMSADEFKKFVQQNGTPVEDPNGRGRVTYEIPEAYRRESTIDYNRPREYGHVRSMSQSRIRTVTPKWEKGQTLSRAEYARLSSDDLRDFHIFLDDNQIPFSEAVH